MSFVHLHVHSEYSLLKASCRLKKIVEKAKSFEMPALALTDFGNMFGAAEFYFLAKDKGIKPILGLEVFVRPSSLGHSLHLPVERSLHLKEKGRNREVERKKEKKREKEKGSENEFGRLVLLAQNKEGYQNLCRISSIGYKEGFLSGSPSIDYEVLKQNRASLIALSGGAKGDLSSTLIKEGEESAVKKLHFFRDIFEDRFYLEINRTGGPSWDKANHFLVQASKSFSIPLVATNDVYYLEQNDHIIHEVLNCIRTNKTLQDESRERLPTDQFYFKSSKEMKELFYDLKEACDKSLEIADRCEFDFQILDENKKPIYHIPTYPTREGFSLKEEIRSLSYKGLDIRFLEMLERKEKVKDKQKYFKRLDYEIDVIHEMGFASYFLIVQDIVQWAKHHNIPVGPGRGSGAGSLVAYALGITDLDPLLYGLIFERFLNPERISMPDFDIDFCQEKRSQVIDYITQKYGESSVSQIITYGTLQARAAVRDVGRVVGMSYTEVDKVAKLVPNRLGIQLQKAVQEEPELADLMEKKSEISILIDLAQKVEGLVRHASIHAAGVVISDGDILRHAPVCRGADGESVIQYDRKYAEKIGLVKFDFLGLKTLTHIHECLNLIKKNRKINITTKDISLSDSGIYSLIRKGDTDGIFQFEGAGITDLLKKARPHRFEDLVAITSLYRPGPMEMIPEYLKRKNKQVKFKYIFPELEDILKETYGIVIYQEQVQWIASRIANYSLAEADILRRAMGKKIPEVMAQQKDRFLSGARKNKYDLKKAEKLFEMMQEFAKYGFNKSHAAAYCVIAAETAYLKNYYPSEFFASLLSTEMGNAEKIRKYIKNAKNSSLQVLSPHINHSEYKFNVSGDKIVFSLGAIKGVGRSAVKSIVKARLSLKERKFDSIESFFETVDLQKVKKNTIECLIKVGAFDQFGYHRAWLLKAYPYFIKRVSQKRGDEKKGQRSFFTMDFDGSQDSEAMNSSTIMDEDKLRLEPLPPWPRSLRLNYEKEVLGFYLNDHPLRGVVQFIGNGNGNGNGNRNGGGSEKESRSKNGNGKFLNIRSAKDFVSQSSQKYKGVFLGLISHRKEIMTRKGSRMAFIELEDLTDNLEVILFPDVYEKFKNFVSYKDPIVVIGELNKREGHVKCVAQSLESLDDFLMKTESVFVYLKPEGKKRWVSLKNLIEKSPGSVPIYIDLGSIKASSDHLKNNSNFGVKKSIQPNFTFFENLSKLLDGVGELKLNRSLI